MSLKNKEKQTRLLTDNVVTETKRLFNFMLVIIFLLQLILPVMVSADASTSDDAIEPKAVEVQAQEENSDADIESPKSTSVTEVPAEEVEEVEVPETPPAPAPEEKEEPGENVVDEPVTKPEENTKEQPNAPPTAPETPEEPETKPEPAPEPEEKVEEPVEEEIEEEVEEEEPEIIVELDPEQMLDGFPAMNHPDNPTPITRFAVGSLGSAMTLLQGSRMIQTTTDLEPGEVRTSKTAEPVQGMVNTWDIKVRLEGRDREIVESTDVVLVIDRSGSMDTNNRMNEAKSAAKNFIDTMLNRDEHLRIGIVSYSSDHTQGWPNPLNSNLVDINSGFSDVAEDLKDAVDDLFAFGGTHTQAGIMQGQALFDASTSDNKYMVLLSDGEPTFSYAPTGWVTVNEQKRGYYNQDRGLFNYSNQYGNGSYNTNSVVGTGSTMVSSTTPYDGSTWPRTISGTEYYPLSRTGGWLSGYTYHPVNRNYIDNGRAAIHASNNAKSNLNGLFTIAVEAGSAGTAVLNNIASEGRAYSTNNPGDLAVIYDHIATQISTQYALRNVDVIDEMGDGFSIVQHTIEATQGNTVVVAPSGGINQKITWTINNPVMTADPDSPGVRYAEMSYRVEINDSILDLDGAKTDESKLFDTNKKTELSYTDIHDKKQTKPIISPKVDPVLLKMKKILTNPATNENRKFNVNIARSNPNFNHTASLVPNAEYIWLTSLRHEGAYNVLETGVTGTPASVLSDFIVSYKIDGENKTNFVVNHPGGNPRGDITIDVTNREIKKINVTGTKVWQGGPAQKPNVTLQLYRNNVAHRSPIILVHPATTHTWTNLEEIDSNGNAYVYTIEEVNPPTGYLSTANGLKVTNIYQIPQKGKATAKKIWQGSDPTDFGEIDLTLWRTLDDVTFEKVPNVTPDIFLDPIVNPNEHVYRYEWNNLVETDINGNPYKFYFTEDIVPDGYERAYLDTTKTGIVNGATMSFALSGGRVRNREMKIDFTFNKVNEVNQPLAGAVFELHKHDGQNRVLVQRIGDTPTSTFTFAGLVKGRYTLTEVSVPDGYVLPEDNTWTFEVVWNDTDKKLEIVFDDGDEIIDGKIANHPKGMLPETGGQGNSLYNLIGVFSLVSLVTIYGWRRKRDEVNQND